jgi:phosphoribosylanthranilate isomerase
MKYPDNILEVSSLLPDYMGFIFWENHRGILMVSSLLYPIDKKSWCFVNETLLLLSKVLKHDLQVVQLHGKNQWAFVKNCAANCQKVLKL